MWTPVVQNELLIFRVFLRNTRKKVPHLIIVPSFILNHDYTEEDEEDEIKALLIHLLHLIQCNPGSKNE